MEQIQRSYNGSHLLDYAISRLTPEVFSHPVWVRFGSQEGPRSLNTVDDLLSTISTLQENDPGTACQVLLICAVYQNHAGQGFNALRTTQQALALSRKHNLVREIVWSLWGICAILIQQGNYEQAGIHLVDLQATLHEQNEWILADFVDIFRQTFSQHPNLRTENASRSSNGQGSNSTLEFTFNWLLQWGLSTRNFETAIPNTSGQVANQTEPIQTFSSNQSLQHRWHTFLLAIRGELSVQWKTYHSPPATRRVSFWGVLLNSLRFYFANRNIDQQVIEDVPQISTNVLSPPAEENLLSDVEIHQDEVVPPSIKETKKYSAEKTTTTIPVAVHMLGNFRMTIGELDAKLPASRSSSILKYLLFHHNQPITRETLMEIFWPDAEPETARNNLNVAMHGLRKALRKIIFLPLILYENGRYGLEPGLQIWLDAEEFERCIQAGRQLESRNQLTAAVTEYETAISLYQGDFLEQDPYEEWTILDRERLRIIYLDTLDHLSQIYFNQERFAACITVCQLILVHDRCREDTHCILMRCYSRQRQYHLALRQYQICVEALQTELDVEPMPETTQLYHQIRRSEPV